jgi:hypothetical protein
MNLQGRSTVSSLNEEIGVLVPFSHPQHRADQISITQCIFICISGHLLCTETANSIARIAKISATENSARPSPNRTDRFSTNLMNRDWSWKQQQMWQCLSHPMSNLRHGFCKTQIWITNLTASQIRPRPDSVQPNGFHTQPRQARILSHSSDNTVLNFTVISVV